MPHEKYLKGFPPRAGGSNVFFLFHHAGGNPSERGKGLGGDRFSIRQVPFETMVIGYFGHNVILGRRGFADLEQRME